ncbi:MAG: hypothetical protein L0H19_01250, partial [Salinisphaera sp.]|nr:hypothetical protein [Salinisphaera sp.]
MGRFEVGKYGALLAAFVFDYGARVQGQVPRLDHLAIAEHDGALDAGLQAGITRGPEMRLQMGAGGVGQARGAGAGMATNQADGVGDNPEGGRVLRSCFTYYGGHVCLLHHPLGRSCTTRGGCNRRAEIFL